MRTIAQLRMLVRNAEAQVEHLSGVIRELGLDEAAVSRHLLTRCQRAHDELALYQAELAALQAPAATPELATLSP